METVTDKQEWTKRVNSLKYVMPDINLPETFVYPKVHIVIYLDTNRRHIKGVFGNIDAARDYKELVERGIKKRSTFQKVMLLMANRYEKVIIETHIVRGYIV